MGTAHSQRGQGPHTDIRAASRLWIIISGLAHQASQGHHGCTQGFSTAGLLGDQGAPGHPRGKPTTQGQGAQGMLQGWGRL